MDINKILNSDYLDILFEGRNKKYGGYELRRKYPNRMRNSLLIGLGVVVLAVAGPAIANIISDNLGKQQKPIMQEVTLAEPPPIDPKKPPPPPPPEPPPPVKPTVKFTPPVIKKDEEVKEDEKPPEVTKMEDKSIGLTNQEGDINGLDAPIEEPGTGVVEAPAAPKVFEYVGQMPEPPYNVSEYLGKNIVYPNRAREENIEGRVTIRFVVNEDGSISGAEVVGKNRPGGGLEEEALRVIRAMPKWKPGKNQGQPVKVYYTQPVTFRLN